MKFGIGARLVLLASVLICVTCFSLLYFMASGATEVVLEHEVLDLGDETELRARELMSEIYALRSDVERVVKEYRAPGQAEPDRKTVETFWRTRVSQPNYLWAEIVWIGPTGEVSWVLQQPEVAVGDIPGRQGIADRVKEKSPSTIVSAIQRIDIPAGTPQSSRRANVIWAGSSSNVEGGVPGRRIAVIVALDLDANRTSPLSDDKRSPLCRVNSSPRHLAVLANDPIGSTFTTDHLVYPYDELKLLPGDKLAERFESLYQRCRETPPEPQESASAQSRRDILTFRTRKIDDTIELQRSVYFLESGPLSDDSIEVAAPVLARLSAARPGNQRIGELLSGVKSIRLLADSPSGIHALKEKILQQLEATPSGKPVAGVTWQKVCPCRNCYVQVVVFPIRSDDAGNETRYFGLAQAAFREEMTADVVDEFNSLIWRGILIVAGAAVVAFAFSLLVTRPLKQITATARSVADADAAAGTDPAESGWRTNISSVIDTLPVKRYDEIGVLARAFRQMLDEVVKGHQRLRKLNADLDRLVKERTAELQETNQTLQTKVQELVEARNAQARFVASISHDLKTPLTTIKGYCELLLESNLTEEQRADQTTIYFARERLQRLIEDIIDSQRIDLGQLKVEMEEFDVAALIHDASRAMKPAAEKNGNTLSVEIDEHIPPMYSDRDKLARIVANLLSNACKFTRQGNVALRATCAPRQAAPWLTIEIADTGRGIPPEFHDRVFSPFPQILDKSQNPDGTGLGLSNCRGYCQAMGGTIRFTSTPGEGTTFTMELPLRAPAPGNGVCRPPNGPAVRSNQPADAGQKGSGSSLVLVIDDEAEARALLKRFLEKLGFEVETAASAADGMRLAVEKKPALVTLDVMMTDGDGWSVLKELKSTAQTRDIPVIMISVLDDKYKGYALGASDYVTKPIDWEQLAHTLRRFRACDNAGNILVVDDDPDLRALASRHLVPLGWNVLEAANGRQALDRLATFRPDIILLDLLMPEMDGFELLHHLRCEEALKAIPVLVVTAKNLTQEDRDRMNGRVLQILNKEAMDWDELEREIRRVLSPQGLIGPPPTR